MGSLNSLYQEMNTFLANQLVFSMKVHNVHWNIKGANFFTLHPKMDEYYEEANTRIDEVAERLLAIGGEPIGNLKEALALASIKERDAKVLQGEELVKILVVDFAQIRDHAIRLIGLADEVSDYGTADYFTGVIREIEKELWMLNAYLQK